ncbi:LysR substrate-binding domain-containing protein [Halomonas sp. HMF6819]|uniref:LysR substrate-binding domain-containing protein n=1 Tax=Halomonas sp. HMF6819 TaxID=3373085 RepID=UPI00378736A6
MSNIREKHPSPIDLNVFLMVIRKSSFAGAAEELGVSAAYISKRIRILEENFDTCLLHRSTRRITLSEDGKLVYQWATRILSDFDNLYSELSASRDLIHGSLKICSSFGFGQAHIGPALSTFNHQHPELNIRLDLIDRVVDLVGEGFDIEIRIGNDLSDNLIARKLADNSRILCATPQYLAQNGTPTSLHELINHECLILKERNNSFGQWTLYRDKEPQTVNVNGTLSTNSGAIVMQWALENHGIVLRSQWEVKPLIEQGKLVQILPEYDQPANIWAVYQTRLYQSAKMKACIEFLEDYFSRYVFIFK